MHQRSGLAYFCQIKHRGGLRVRVSLCVCVFACLRACVHGGHPQHFRRWLRVFFSSTAIKHAYKHVLMATSHPFSMLGGSAER